MAPKLAVGDVWFETPAELEEGLYSGRWLKSPWGETWQILAYLCLNHRVLAKSVANLWWEQTQRESKREVPLALTSMGNEQGEADTTSQLVFESSAKVALAHVREHVHEMSRLETLTSPLIPWIIGGQARLHETLWQLSHLRLEELRQQLAHDAALRALFIWLGRTLDGKGQGEQAKHGDERQGLAQGNDLREVLPSEWALLAEPDTEMLFWARYAARQLSVFEPFGEQQAVGGSKRRGPVVVCLDTSASMQRDLEAQAKALTLELIQTMRTRRVEVVLFGGEGARKWYSFTAAKTSPEALLEFLMGSFGRATDLSGVLRDALARLSESNLTQADLVVLSDGRAPLDAELTAHMQARRAEGLRVAVIYPEPSGESFEPTLAAFSDLDAVLKAGKLHPRQGDWQALVKRSVA